MQKSRQFLFSKGVIKALLWSGLLMLVILILVLPIMPWYSAKLYGPRLKSETAQLLSGLQGEVRHLAESREQVLKRGDFVKFLQDKDLLSLIALSEELNKKFNTRVFSSLDSDGFVLNRASLPSQRGDNIYLVTGFGEELSHGKSFVGFREGARLPLLFIAGAAVKQNNVAIGSFLLGYSVDNLFASSRKNQHLKHADLAFYDQDGEVVGTSVTDSEVLQGIENLTVGLKENLQNFNFINKVFKLDGSNYVIRNLEFKDYGIGDGGALLLVKVSRSALMAYFSFIRLIIFIAILFAYLSIRKVKLKTKADYLGVLIVALLVIVSAAYAEYVQFNRSLVISKKTSYLIYNSVISIYPEAEIVIKGLEKRVQVKVDTGGESINAVEAVINFDPTIAKVVNLGTDESLCSLFLEKVVDNEKGKVTISCAVPNPGFFGNSGILAELDFHFKKTGNLELGFEDETRILANDGLATNVLRQKIGAFYKIKESEGDDTFLFSSSHPNSRRWYSDPLIEFNWIKRPGTIYEYHFGKGENLGQSKRTDEDTVVKKVEADGEYFFHLLPISKGVAELPLRYRVKIDSTPPQKPVIRASQTRGAVNDVVRLDFTSKDEMSGLQNTFYVKINDGILLPVKPPFYVPIMEKGDIRIMVRAFDNAGNTSDSELIITGE